MRRTAEPGPARQERAEAGEERAAHAPLTVGTAGHVDHGKTALVAALTGVDTDRLPQEHERGLSIELGYAALALPGGRRLSLVDVPGHERFVRTMVAGASGVDLFLLVVAADDGVMPQTREHVEVLRALHVRRGVVAVTKTDLADPAPASAAVVELLGSTATAIVPCSVRTERGVEAVRAALARVAAQTPSRAVAPGAPLLHVDRSFTIRGAGSVATGTLWSGSLGVGEQLVLLPDGGRARIRALQVHGVAVERAAAGQRVAVNLSGIRRAEIERGMVLAGEGVGVEPAWILDAALQLADPAPPRRVHVHHGTRATPARLVQLGGSLFQLRCELPLLARRGDRVVVRAIAPPATLGGGRVLDPRAPRRGPGTAVVERSERLARGGPVLAPVPEATVKDRHSETPPIPLTPAALELERRLLAAGDRPPPDTELGDAAEQLPALRAAGRVVRLGAAMHVHPEALATVRERVTVIVQEEGSITVARLRDDLGSSRRYAQALLEHCDAVRLTLRLPDDRRVLRGRRRS